MSRCTGKITAKSIRAAWVGTVPVTEKYLARGIFVTSEMRRPFTPGYRSRTQSCTLQFW